MKKICETCTWWHDSACVCMNEKSDKFTEQVAHTEDCDEWEEDDEDWEDYQDLEIGFDPYLGCYTDDC